MDDVDISSVAKTDTRHQLMPDVLASIQWSADGDFQRHVTDEVSDSNLRDLCSVDISEMFEDALTVDHKHVLLETSRVPVDSRVRWAHRQVAASGRVSAVVTGDDCSHPRWRSAGWSRVAYWEEESIRCGEIDQEHNAKLVSERVELWQLKPLFEMGEDLVSDSRSLWLDPRQADAKKVRVVRVDPIKMDYDRMLDYGMHESTVNLARNGDGEEDGAVPLAQTLSAPCITENYPMESDARVACVEEFARMVGRGILVRASDCPDVVLSDVHSWVMVWQNSKWRGAVDCKSVNERTDNMAFDLPTHSDLASVVEPGMTSLCAKDMSDGFFHVSVNRKHRGKFAVQHPVTGEVFLFTALPFGWVLSPFWFTRFSEDVGRIMEREARAAVHHECMRRGWSDDARMKVLTYVDDYLLAVTHYHHEVLCQVASDAMDKVAADMGVELAPHKAVGPVPVIEWLGLLLDARAGSEVSMRLPESKRKRYLGELRELHVVYRVQKDVPARLLAGVIGRLNFAARVVPGGMIHMARMWDRFRGVLVDWGRGRVEVVGGVRNIKLTREFWLDVEWWFERLRREACVLLVRGADNSWEARAGTDGSDWGSGQFVV